MKLPKERISRARNCSWFSRRISSGVEGGRHQFGADGASDCDRGGRRAEQRRARLPRRGVGSQKRTRDKQARVSLWVRRFAESLLLSWSSWVRILSTPLFIATISSRL
jgi:hypothetical protein